MLKFGPFSGHFDYLARIRVLARNFGSTGSSAELFKLRQGAFIAHFVGLSFGPSQKCTKSKMDYCKAQSQA